VQSVYVMFRFGDVEKGNEESAPINKNASPSGYLEYKQTQAARHEGKVQKNTRPMEAVGHNRVFKGEERTMNL